jgi:hypothetical protein
LVLAIGLGLPLVAGHYVGRAYTPRALAPTSAEVNRTAHFLTIFGNSRTEAAISTARLERGLSAPDRPVEARMYNGAGWNALDYYELALLNRDRLRPGRDAVIIESSPLSTNDRQRWVPNIRPEVALSVVAIPGLAAEHRLDILLGAVAGLYRYRSGLWDVAIGPRLERLAQGAGRGLAAVGLVGPSAKKQPFEVVIAPERPFVIQDVRGDRAALTALHRPRLQREIAEIAGGGPRLEALRRAVGVLRARGITVYLLEVPSSRWLNARLYATAAGQHFLEALETLATSSGAILLRRWPEPLFDDNLFWDEIHMVGAASDRFTDELAKRIGADLNEPVRSTDH